MRKTVVISHVYEVTFRFETPERLDDDEVSDFISDLNSHIQKRNAGPASVRELCYDQETGDTCLLTDGHRGPHEGATGNRWGHDL